MSITPNEIIEKEFSVKLRGYNREEVNAFLEEVANYLATVIKERNELKDRVMALKRQITFLKQQEAEFRRALTAAHKAAEDMKVSAKKKAELIVERAKLDGERIVQDAHKEAIELEDRIRRLRMLQRETVFKIRSSFEGFLRMLDEDMALPPEDVDETLKITAQEVRAIQGDEIQEGSSNINTGHTERETKEATPEATVEKAEIEEIEEELSDAKKVERLRKEFGFEPSKLWPSD